MSGLGLLFSAFILKTRLRKEHIETVTGVEREKGPVVEEVLSS